MSKAIKILKYLWIQKFYTSLIQIHLNKLLAWRQERSMFYFMGNRRWATRLCRTDFLPNFATDFVVHQIWERYRRMGGVTGGHWGLTVLASLCDNCDVTCHGMALAAQLPPHAQVLAGQSGSCSWPTHNRLLQPMQQPSPHFSNLPFRLLPSPPPQTCLPCTHQPCSGSHLTR